MKDVFKLMFCRIKNLAYALDYRSIIIPGIMLSFELFVRAIKRRSEDTCARYSTKGTMEALDRWRK